LLKVLKLLNNFSENWVQKGFNSLATGAAGLLPLAPRQQW